MITIISACGTECAAQEEMHVLYKKKLLRSFIGDDYENHSFSQKLKEITIKDVIYWIAESWDSVKSETIIKLWRNLLPDFMAIDQRVRHK